MKSNLEEFIDIFLGAELAKKIDDAYVKFNKLTYSQQRKIIREKGKYIYNKIGVLEND
jgi:hypothetical protein